MRDERFGRLLRAAIGSIVTHEGTTAPLVEVELGSQIGLSPASIQRYKAGHIPPDPRTVALFAEAGVRRGFLNAGWLRAFLHAARFYDAPTLMAQLYPDAVPVSPPAPGTSGRPRHNLPAPTYAQFVPRGAASEVLDGLRQRTSAVLLTGLGGMGKTSLAREVAAHCLSEPAGGPAFAAAVWVSDQDHPGSTTLDATLATIARTLDYPGLLQLDHAARRHAVEGLLRQSPVLLVLDQCETIADTDLLAWALRLPEPSKALLISRVERPELRQGSWLVPLAGLEAHEAATFFEQQVRALRLGGRVRDRRQLDRLYDAAGGNPKVLALALGALRSGPRTLQQVLDELAGAPGSPADVVLARSWELIDADARRVLLVASLFAGSIHPDALAATAGVEAPRAGHLIARLAESSLLDVLHLDLEQPPRYTLHPLVRAFAGIQLATKPELVREARLRQLAWYAELASTVGYCWDDLARLNILDPEQETLTTLIRWAIRERAPELGRLVSGVDYYYYIRGLWALLPELGAAREAAARAAGDSAEATRALAYQIQMHCRQRQFEAVTPRLEELIALRESPALMPDVRFEVAYTLGLYWAMREQYDEAIRCWEQALPLSWGLSVRAYAVNRGWLAICHYHRGEQAQAAELWAAVLRDASAGGFTRGVVSSQIGLARVALDQGDTSEAQGLLAAAHEAAQAHGDRAIIAEIQTLLARCHDMNGEADAAHRLLATAHATYERLGLVREQEEVYQIRERVTRSGRALPR